MTERDEMVRLLAADAPAPLDLSFEVAVAARIEKRRFRREIAINASLAIAGALFLVLLMPGLETIWRVSFAAIGNVAIATLLCGLMFYAQRWTARWI